MPKVVDHDQRRAEIIGALWEVISERGTEGASLMTVARAAGVSVGRIQHYFASKQDLVQAGCQAIVDMAEAGYRDRTRESDPWRTLADLLYLGSGTHEAKSPRSPKDPVEARSEEHTSELQSPQ